MDRLDDMCVFIRVVDARSFTLAAERLGLSKSAVSRRMADLENRLGARLLNRTTRSLSLTEVGRAFYDRCARIVADVEEAERAVADLHAQPRGTLRINAPMSFGMMHIAPAIAEFLRRHPGLEIDMDLNDRYIDLIEEGYDVAVRIGRLRDSSLVARRLAPNRRVVVGSPAYFKAHGRPVDPDDLAGHNCLIYTNAPLADQWQFRIDGEVRSVKVSGTLRVNNGEVLREAAVGGHGIAILPTFIIGEQIASGRLDVVLMDFVAGDSAVHAVYPHGRHLSPKVRVFVDFLAGRFGPVPYWDASLHVLTGG
ncbi:LysR family transcriptional regulator [Skermanella mucosa]|uniref:LysR family transcriptional regulator n=1 Tax=Skermanella mucosa TaxID=1789672 RepID=UPI00192C9C28|nr:LysR family transcriptional regulator [Skermanella mucosa]UEM18909.1 LysR family transcriptional regulator [Skermanella mucosa]